MRTSFACIIIDSVLDIPQGKGTRNKRLYGNQLLAQRSLAQRREIVVTDRSAWRGRSAFKKQTAQTLTILIVANQFTHIFAARAVAAFRHLLIDKMLQAVGQ